MKVTNREGWYQGGLDNSGRSVGAVGYRTKCGIGWEKGTRVFFVQVIASKANEYWIGYGIGVY